MQFYKFNQEVRSISFIPNSVWFFLCLGLLLQIGWHSQKVERSLKISNLPSTPKESVIRIFSLDEKIASSKFLMLWLQAFDNQPGISLSFKQLDYDRLISWLNLIYELDPRSEYPLLSASRIYTEVPDNVKRKKMLDFVLEKFLEEPGKRWQWMTHAIYVAKHKMKDLDLALRLARKIRENTSENQAPYWARQMEIFILEDKGELESAMIIIGGLLDSGELDDPHQREFLEQRLKEIEQRQSENLN